MGQDKKIAPCKSAEPARRLYRFMVLIFALAVKRDNRSGELYLQNIRSTAQLAKLRGKAALRSTSQDLPVGVALALLFGRDYRKCALS